LSIQLNINFQNNLSFAKKIQNGKKINKNNESPIIEENSNSISPETSFIRDRLPYTTHFEKHVREDYYSQGPKIIVEETQK